MRWILVAALLALCTACSPARVRGDLSPEESAREARRLVDRAIDAAGGRRALARQSTLAWHGEATVHVAGKHIGIGVRTVVHADGRSESTSWRLGQSESEGRTMSITPDAGTVAKVGAKPEPLPDEITVHEREQYSLYQVARLLPLDDAELSALPPNAAGEPGVVAEIAGFAPRTLRFDAKGRLVEIRHTIDAPGRDHPVEQVLRFGGTFESNGVRWFRTLNITWNGLPYFDLMLKSFEARAAAPAASRD